jgi:hypothetical protein
MTSIEHLECISQARFVSQKPNVVPFIEILSHGDFHSIKTPFLRGFVCGLTATSRSINHELYEPYLSPSDRSMISIGETVAISMLGDGWLEV